MARCITKEDWSEWKIICKLRTDYHRILKKAKREACEKYKYFSREKHITSSKNSEAKYFKIINENLPMSLSSKKL